MSHDSTGHTGAMIVPDHGPLHAEPEARLLHTSDWHLGAPRYWGSDHRFKFPDSSRWIDRLWDLREKAIESIVDKALKGSYHAVLVAGDVFDHPNLGPRALPRVEAFLRTRVIERLAVGGIALILTPGTHDYRPAEPLETVRVLHALAQEYHDVVSFIVPGRSRLRFGVDTVAIRHVLVSPDRPGRNPERPWVEFLHNKKDSSRRGDPLYRAFGDRHSLTMDRKRRMYHPGSPFVRSTGTDGGAGAGPRFVMSVIIRGSRCEEPEPERLPVAETAVLKKVSRKEWQLLYDVRNPAVHRWRGSVGTILDRARKELQKVAFLTLVLDRLESAPTISRCWSEAGEWGQAIRGSRPGIISVWLQ